MRYTQILAWIAAEGWPRFKAIFKRATAEDDHFQLLAHVSEAKTCIQMSERIEGELVEDWEPEDYRRQAIVELQQAEAILRRIGGYH